MALQLEDIKLICAFVLRRSGIVLDESKRYLIEARLTQLARQQNLPSIEALVAKLRGPGALRMEEAVTQAMTTNETSFFRDGAPFDALRRFVLPELIKSRSIERSLNIWCAASSTGQEPYSIAIILRDAIPNPGDWKINFLASDLSNDVLQKARQGRFNQLEIRRGMPADLLAKHFRKEGADWQIHADLRAMINFRAINLLEPWPMMPPLDLVFIRNVLIYFGAENKRQILGRLRERMRPDASLFLGVAETTLNVDDRFARAAFDKSGCYRITPARVAA